MIFLRLTPLWSNYYRYLYFRGFFQRTYNRGDIRHITNFRFWRTVEEAKLFQGNKDTIWEQAREHKKTNFRFLGNRGTSQIISEEQRNRYPRPRSVLPCILGPKSSPVQSDSKPSPYDPSCWWDIKHKIKQSINPGIFFFQTTLSSDHMPVM